MSDFYHQINAILAQYEKKRGFFSRLFGFFGVPGFGRPPVIKALRKLNLNLSSEKKAKEKALPHLDLKPFFENKAREQEIEILQCLIENRNDNEGRDLEVYIGVMKVLFPLPFLSTDNFEKIFKSLCVLYKEKFLTSENIEVIKAHAAPDSLALGLKTLSEADLLTPENIKAIKLQVELVSFNLAMSCFAKAAALTQENFDVLKVHTKPYNLFYALDMLDRSKILTLENINIIKRDAKPMEMASRMVQLKQAGRLTPENIDIIKREAQVDRLDTMIEIAKAPAVCKQTKKQSRGYALGFFNQETPSEDALAPSQVAHSSSSLNP